MIHLDTSFLVDLLREAGRGEEGPAGRLLEGELAREELGASVHVVCELHAGVELSSRRREERARVHEVCEMLRIVHPEAGFAEAYGKALAAIRRRGDAVSTMDLLIGTAALVRDAPLVTRNVRDFLRIPGLEVIEYGERWAEPSGQRDPTTFPAHPRTGSAPPGRPGPGRPGGLR